LENLEVQKDKNELNRDEKKPNGVDIEKDTKVEAKQAVLALPQRSPRSKLDGHTQPHTAPIVTQNRFPIGTG
jgi:hypothetical protein